MVQWERFYPVKLKDEKLAWLVRYSAQWESQLNSWSRIFRLHLISRLNLEDFQVGKWDEYRLLLLLLMHLTPSLYSAGGLLLLLPLPDEKRRKERGESK
jgi:hypothetical protein